MYDPYTSTQTIIRVTVKKRHHLAPRFGTYIYIYISHYHTTTSTMLGPVFQSLVDHLEEVVSSPRYLQTGLRFHAARIRCLRIYHCIPSGSHFVLSILDSLGNVPEYLHPLDTVDIVDHFG